MFTTILNIIYVCQMSMSVWPPFHVSNNPFYIAFLKFKLNLSEIQTFMLWWVAVITAIIFFTHITFRKIGDNITDIHFMWYHDTMPLKGSWLIVYGFLNAKI